METLRKFRTFVRESWNEVRNMVTWPSKAEVKGTTTVVLVTTVAFALYLALVDFVMVTLITRVFERFA